jgi:transposase
LFAALEVDTEGGERPGHRESAPARSGHRVQEVPLPPQRVQIDEEVPNDLDVHLILDNYATHKTPEIKRWLLRHPRFHLHFTPTSSSWLKMVERWFGELTTKKIKCGAHASVRALEKDIRDWITTWNENPRSYVWVKTEDQILAALARCCERVSAASSHASET